MLVNRGFPAVPRADQGLKRQGDSLRIELWLECKRWHAYVWEEVEKILGLICL